MRTTYSFRQMFTVMLGAALLISGPATAFGRDDDKKGQGKSQKKQGRGDRGSERQQERGDRNAERQQKQSDRESRSSQRHSDWNSQMQQRRSDSESRRQQRSSERKSDRVREIWNGEIPRGRPVWNGRDPRRGDDDDRRDRGRDRRDNRVNRDAAPPVWSIFGGERPVFNYGRDVGGPERRLYKDERKAQRRYEKEQRRYVRNYDRSLGGDFYANNNNYNSNENSYYSNDNSYENGADWQQQLLRVVIANVIGNRLGGEQYSGFTPNAPVYQNQPSYGGGYRAVPQYAADYGDSYQYQPGYDNGGGLLSGDLLDSLPIAELVDQLTGGGGFASELLGNLLTQGYDQGFLAGQSARQNGYGDEYYQDPYVYQGGVHDSYSASVGENRRCLSQGYEIGYQDALNGQSGYDPQSRGNADLVSLLLGTVLSGI